MIRFLITTSFLISTLFSTALFAASPTSTKTSPNTKRSISRPKPTTPPPSPVAVHPVESDSGVTFAVAYNLRYTIQAEQQTDNTRDEYYTHELIPSISTTNYRFRAVMDFYDHFKAPQGNAWDPTAIEMALNNPWNLTDYFLVKPEFTTAFLLFKTESQSNNLNSFLGARVNLILNSKNTIPDLVLKYNIQLGKFNYKETCKKDPTTQACTDYYTDTRLRHRLFLGYMITDSLMPMVFFQFDSNFLNDNSVVNKFYHETFIEYTFTGNIAVDVGIANGGGLYTGEYQDVNNLKFYNKESSEYFVQLNLSI